MFRTGYLTVARLRGIPIRLHWSIPVGAFVFGRFQIVPGFWLGFFLLILIHELGHAALVRRYRLSVEAVDVHGLGGLCRYSGYPSDLERAVIAWGGVLAQAALLGVTWATLWLLGPPTTAFGADLVYAFTTGNLIIGALNLLPVPPLDGAEAWKVFGLWRARRKRWRKKPTKQRKEPVPVVDVEEVSESVQDALRRAAREAARRRKRPENQR
jgi:Zn-dependent protease